MRVGEAIRWPHAGKGLFLALLIVAPLYLFGTFNHDLWRPAEAREAAIAKEMIDSGNWVATYLNGNLFLEKPPLYTWALAGAMKIFGFTDWAVRVPVFLFTIATLAVAYFLARRGLGTKGAVASCAALATMALFNEVNRGAMIDNGLMFFTSLALFSFYRFFEAWRAQDRSSPTAGNQKFFSAALSGRLSDPAFGWATLFYVMLGLSFLCKGIIGPALILTPCAGFVVFGRRWKLIPGIYPFFGAFVVLAIAGSWLFALWQKGGHEYFQVFFVDNHLNRFTGSYGPVKARYYYFYHLLLAAMPWTILAVPAAASLKERLAGTGHEHKPFWSFIFWWIGSMFVLLNIAGSKDNQYLLPLLPAAAVFFGAFVERTLSDSPMPRWWHAFLWVFCVAVALFISVMPFTPLLFSEKPGFLSFVTSVLLLGIGFGVILGLKRKQWPLVWTRLAVMITGAGICLHLFVEPALNKVKSSRPTWDFIQSVIPEDAVCCEYSLDENTLGFLYYYGLAPCTIRTTEDAMTAANENDSAWLLLRSWGDMCEMPEQLSKSGKWWLADERRFGSRHYMIFRNKPRHSP